MSFFAPANELHNFLKITFWVHVLLNCIQMSIFHHTVVCPTEQRNNEFIKVSISDEHKENSKSFLIINCWMMVLFAFQSSAFVLFFLKKATTHILSILNYLPSHFTIYYGYHVLSFGNIYTCKSHKVSSTVCTVHCI